MNCRKKILILTVTCGEGHNSIANAISNELKNQGAEVRVEDLFATKPSKQKFYNKFYLWSCKHIPHLYEMFWKIAKRIKTKDLKNSPAVKNTKNFSNYFQSVIHKFQPDTIVCTHNEAGALLAFMKQNNMISQKIKTITIVFDYTLCPFWDTNKYLDYCIIPSNVVRRDLLKLGYKNEQIKCFGFPVNSVFYNKWEKQETRKQLGIENKFTFLSIAGGNNLGNPIKLLKQILKTKGDYQVVMLCSKNKKSKQLVDDYIKKNNLTNVYCFGFVQNVAKVMNACDVAFSRGGSGVINECFSQGLPIIFRQGLIVNEKVNRDLFVKLKCAFYPKTSKEITNICQTVLTKPHILESYKQNIKRVLKTEPVVGISKFIINKA